MTLVWTVWTNATPGFRKLSKRTDSLAERQIGCQEAQTGLRRNKAAIDSNEAHWVTVPAAGHGRLLSCFEIKLPECTKSEFLYVCLHSQIIQLTECRLKQILWCKSWFQLKEHRISRIFLIDRYSPRAPVCFSVSKAVLRKLRCQLFIVHLHDWIKCWLCTKDYFCCSFVSWANHIETNHHPAFHCLLQLNADLSLEPSQTWHHCVQNMSKTNY